VPFLGLTVQPCGEPCGSAAGFDFLTVEVIQIKKKTHSSQCLNLCQWLVACSTSGRFGSKNMCKKTKKNRRQTELDGGWGVGRGVLLFSVSQTIQGTERHKKTSPPMVVGAQNSGNTVYIFCTYLIALVM